MGRIMWRGRGWSATGWYRAVSGSRILYHEANQRSGQVIASSRARCAHRPMPQPRKTPRKTWRFARSTIFFPLWLSDMALRARVLPLCQIFAIYQSATREPGKYERNSNKSAFLSLIPDGTPRDALAPPPAAPAPPPGTVPAPADILDGNDSPAGGGSGLAHRP